ncbi:MAG: hypothetical protein H0V58_05380 [Actinobacteria bacterium]|nr:hypothetical protein [Actinomycetota bacterium]
MRSFALLAAVVAAVAVPATALAEGKVFFEDTLPAGTSSSVTFRTHKAASFRVVLRVPTQGRAQLFLTGKTAPRGGPLIDTKTYACEGAAGSYYCRAAYEPLPKGTYAWRIRWLGSRPAHVELTVRW